MKKLSLLNKIKPASAWAWSLLITVILYGCITEPKFPKEPRIFFESIRKNNVPQIGVDSVIITIRFEDGDGDLGLTEPQQANEDPWKDGKVFNYEVETLVKRGNTWQDYTDRQGLKVNLSGNFTPLVEPTSKPSPIEGTLDRSIVVFKNLRNPSIPNDTLKFNILIRDRALHESNRVETGPIVVYGNK